MNRYGFSDNAWLAVEDLLTPLPHHGAGRPPADPRRVLAGILWVLHTGSPWRDLPSEFGPWHTAYNHFRQWRLDGTFKRILSRLRLRLARDGRVERDLWLVDSSMIRGTRAAAGARKKGVRRGSQRTTRSGAHAAASARSSILSPTAVAYRLGLS